MNFLQSGKDGMQGCGPREGLIVENYNSLMVHIYLSLGPLRHLKDTSNDAIQPIKSEYFHK